VAGPFALEKLPSKPQKINDRSNEFASQGSRRELASFSRDGAVPLPGPLTLQKPLVTCWFSRAGVPYRAVFARHQVRREPSGARSPLRDPLEGDGECPTIPRADYSLVRATASGARAPNVRWEAVPRRRARSESRGRPLSAAGIAFLARRAGFRGLAHPDPPTLGRVSAFGTGAEQDEPPWP
jgi:hypothetical protein